MKRLYILPVYLVFLGLCYGQSRTDVFSTWPLSSNAVAENNSATENHTAAEPTVSLARLSHRIPGKAVSAFSRALKLARRHDWRQGARELEDAVAVDPDFSEAHANLGVHYLMLEDYSQAVSEFRRAIRLDSGVSMYHSNLALAYLLLRRPNEAKIEAETAVSLDARNAKGQYLLGFLLARNPAERGDAQKHLNFAAQEVPQAHLALVDLYHAAGDESKASAELERYRRAMALFEEHR